MKHLKWQIFFGFIMIAISVSIYLIHYAIFRDSHQIFFYLINDIAFVFIQVLLVTLIIDRVLNLREKRILMEKMNMVIGSFFSEVGKELVKQFSTFDPNAEKIRQDLIVTSHWSAQQFSHLGKQLKQYAYGIDIHKGDLLHLKQTLIKHREFLLRLLENQNLLEHDTFTNLLMAVFHLTEELESRTDIRQLPQADQNHIAGDMKRAYGLLVIEWLNYMNHLRENYPYLFSFAMRTNPYDLNASPEIME